MIELHVCPSTLAEGFDTYSPQACKLLFDGKAVSHVLSSPSPNENSPEAKEAIRGIGRLSLSGVQSKFAVVVDEGKTTLRYVRQGEKGVYILKPCPNAYHLYDKEYCAANEHLTMQIASQVYGIETAANAVCFFSNDEMAYLTRRFDMYAGGKYQQEDFAALMGYTRVHGGSDFKYCNASYEECAELIRRHVKAASIDVLRFFRLVLFNFITLNDDAHLKNFSLVNRGKEYRLSPAYDLINTSLHLGEPRLFALDKGLFKEGMSLSDTRFIKRGDFEEFGRRIGLPERVVKKEIERFIVPSEKAAWLVEHSFLPARLKEVYLAAMKYRQRLLTF